MGGNNMNRLKKILIFIATIILVMSSTSFLKVDAKTASYMMLFDKEHQAYNYTDGTSKRNPTHNKKLNRTSWIYYQNGIGGYTERQTSKGYYINDGLALKFPIKKNLSWKIGKKEQRKIISTKTKVKTKYKTFKNAVKVDVRVKVGKSTEKSYEYFVPNYGIVKVTANGTVFGELESITDSYGKETK